jgi:hypothetical protein
MGSSDEDLDGVVALCVGGGHLGDDLDGAAMAASEPGPKEVAVRT